MHRRAYLGALVAAMGLAGCRGPTEGTETETASGNGIDETVTPSEDATPSESLRAGAPDLSLSFDWDGSLDPDSAQYGGGGDGVVTITHQGGDAVVAGKFRIDGMMPDPTTLADGSDAYGMDDEFRPGDTVTVAAAAGSTVSVAWLKRHGATPVPLDSFSVPS